MISRLSPFVLVSLLFTGCGPGGNNELQAELDSLRQAVANNERISNELAEVGALLDSIDANRQVLKVNMIEGTTYDDYSERMKDLNDYVKQTEAKISEMEKALGSSRSLAATYSKMISKLKLDLESRSAEITALQEQVEKYRNENRNLVDLATLQEAELSDKQLQIEAKEQELAVLESRIQNLIIDSKMSEADATFARAQAMEEAANRTKLAPRKKKETLGEALELYKKALSLGKTEAGPKIRELEEKL